jgi:hypothetical protein
MSAKIRAARMAESTLIATNRQVPDANHVSWPAGRLSEIRMKSIGELGPAAVL